VPALPPYLIEPIWEQFKALLPEHESDHPLGCHRRRIPDGVVFGKLVQILVSGCAYERIADEGCSESTLRRRRDEWIGLGVTERLRHIALETYDRLIGLRLSDLAVDCCITKAPCGGERSGRSPVDRGKGGLKRSTAVDASGIPLAAVTAAANRHDPPLLGETLDALGALGEMPGGARVHLDRACDSAPTRRELAARHLVGEISEKGKPAPVQAGLRWVVERTSSWHNAHEKLVWCTERRAEVIDFWVAFSDVVIVVRRPIREGWTRYRWEDRPSRRP
jgi:transposase